LYLADILVKQERLSEAEEMLLEVADGHRKMSAANKGEHPDRVKALDNLATCYELQYRLDEAIDTCEQAIDGLNALGGHAHPYMKKLRDKHARLSELRKAP
jgi:tetratricopeptide (TPR) repeat protein